MGTRAEPRAHQAAAPRPAQITPAQALYYTQFYRLKKSFNPSTTLCFLLIIRAKVAEGFDFLILQQGSAAISRNRYKRHHKQAVEQETAKAAKILGFIGDFGFWLFKNPRFHRRFFHSAAARVSGRSQRNATSQSRLLGVQSQGLKIQSLDFARQTQGLRERGGKLFVHDRISTRHRRPETRSPTLQQGSALKDLIFKSFSHFCPEYQRERKPG